MYDLSLYQRVSCHDELVNGIYIYIFFYLHHYTYVLNVLTCSIQLLEALFFEYVHEKLSLIGHLATLNKTPDMTSPPGMVGDS